MKTKFICWVCHRLKRHSLVKFTIVIRDWKIPEDPKYSKCFQLCTSDQMAITDQQLGRRGTCGFATTIHVLQSQHEANWSARNKTLSAKSLVQPTANIEKVHWCSRGSEKRVIRSVGADENTFGSSFDSERTWSKSRRVEEGRAETHHVWRHIVHFLMTLDRGGTRKSGLSSGLQRLKQDNALTAKTAGGERLSVWRIVYLGMRTTTTKTKADSWKNLGKQPPIGAGGLHSFAGNGSERVQISKEP